MVQLRNRAKGNKLDNFSWYRDGIKTGSITDRKARREYERKLNRAAKKKKNANKGA